MRSREQTDSASNTLNNIGRSYSRTSTSRDICSGLVGGGAVSAIFGVLATAVTGLSWALIATSPRAIVASLGATVTGLAICAVTSVFERFTPKPLFDSGKTVFAGVLLACAASYYGGQHIADYRMAKPDAAQGTAAPTPQTSAAAPR